jgi:hypothetical protein
MTRLDFSCLLYSQLCVGCPVAMGLFFGEGTVLLTGGHAVGGPACGGAAGSGGGVMRREERRWWSREDGGHDGTVFS